MNRLRILLWGLVVLAPIEQAWGSTSAAIDDSGLVCLDARTGKPIWEFFHPDQGWIYLTWDGQRLHLSNRNQWVNPLRPEASKNDNGRVFAVDPETGEGVEIDYSPESSDADEKDYISRYVRTHLGDTVVADPSNARAITVMRGETQEPRFIISTPDFYSHYLIHQQWIVYAPSYHESTPPTKPIAIAVNAESGAESWRLMDGGYFRGIGGGKENLYVAQSGSLRALDPATGEERWKQRLPRIRGWTKVTEHDGAVYVICDQDGAGHEIYFLYCLDAATGTVRWEFDPGFMHIRPTLVFHKGKVITRIRPTNWIAESRATIEVRLQLTRATSGGSPSAGTDRFAERLGGKTVPDIELTMRAWHALGDRAGLAVLDKAAELAIDTPHRELAKELRKSFPPTRDGLRLLEFLEHTYNSDPGLRPEVAKIVRDLDPSWTYRKREENWPKLPAEEPHEPTVNEKLWAQAYEALRNKVLMTPITVLTRESLVELALGEAYAELEFLTTRYETSNDPDEKRLLRMAIVKKHPSSGSDWALTRISEYDAMETGQWSQAASSDWLFAHEQFFWSWLTSDDSFVQGNAARKLVNSNDSARAVALSRRLLRDSDSRPFSGGYDSRAAALRILARTGDASHVPLIQEFARGGQAVENTSSAQDSLNPVLAQEVDKALVALGTLKEPPVKTIVEQRCLDTSTRYGQLMKLESDLYMARRTSDAVGVANTASELLSRLAVDEKDFSQRDELLAKAYEALGKWDNAIIHWRAHYAEHPDWGFDKIMPLLAKAGRIEEMEQMIKEARAGDEVIVQGAHLFIELKRYDRAEELLRAAIAGDANDAGACIGLALVMAQREEFAEADAMMERAIALRPHPSFCDSFGHTITYWLKRGKPERAIAWMTTAVAEDRRNWERDGLFEWAEQFAELKEAVGKLRAEGAGDSKR